MVKIHETAIVFPGVVIEDGVEIGPLCIIGAPPEHKAHYKDKPAFGVIIRKGSIITGAVTIDAGTVRDTEIKEDCFIMKGAHIGHDAIIGDGVVISPKVIICGHVEIGEKTNLGAGSAVHQFVKVPPLCMVGINTTITKRTYLIENSVYIGSPAKRLRKNHK